MVGKLAACACITCGGIGGAAKWLGATRSVAGRLLRAVGTLAALSALSERHADAFCKGKRGMPAACEALLIAGAAMWLASMALDWNMESNGNTSTLEVLD